MANIAIVDDEKIMVNSLSIALEDEGYNVDCYYDGENFFNNFENSCPDLILLDIRLPDVSGLEILEKIKPLENKIQVIMITAHGDIDTAIKAMKLGAYDFINKPFELDEIILLVDKALKEQKRLIEINHHRSKLFDKAGLEDIIGESETVFQLIQQIKKISEIENCTVLIRGESGTGKELVAKAIHKLSKKKENSFIDINCSAFPDNLLESELFGFEKGAFTDAKGRKIGLIEMANGGTLFLDEIGEFPLNLQAKLLRFLESKSFRRIGGNTEIKVDTRIIAATNRDLESMIEDGKFRKDLFYRLNVIPINVPSLRDRQEDAVILAEYFIEEFSKKFSKEKIILSQSVKAVFSSYNWPGNIRELRNLIERLVIMSSSHLIDLEHLPPEMQTFVFDKNKNKNIFSNEMNLDKYLEKIEYELIQDAIIKSKGVKSEAAKILGISRFSLNRRLERIERNKNVK